MSSRVFVVTGANRGIGFETVKELGKRLKFNKASIVLCSRSASSGQEAVSKLAREGLKADFEQLDITEEGSRNRFISAIRDKYAHVDCLVNNAGIAISSGGKQLPSEQAKAICDVNYFGTRDITLALAPLFSQNMKVVFVTSNLQNAGPPFMSKNNRDRLMAPTATVKDIDEAVRDYIEVAPNWRQNGWPVLPYLFSKAAVIALSAAFARQANEHTLSPKAGRTIVTACYPGWCKTDMAGWKKPPLSAADGAKVVAQLAMCAGSREHGNLVLEGKDIKVPSEL